jgi:hypothetical protein
MTANTLQSNLITISANLLELSNATVANSQLTLNLEFKFKLIWDAANHNAEVLKTYGFNLGMAIDANHDSLLGYGSKFQPANVLQSVFYLHPNWLRWKKLLTHGSNWPLDKLDDNMQKKDVNEALTLGSHKGATSQLLLLQQLIVKDITYGFGLAILLSTVHSIQGTHLALMKIMKQNTINEQGRIIPKDRLTRNQN